MNAKLHKRERKQRFSFSARKKIDEWRNERNECEMREKMKKNKNQNMREGRERNPKFYKILKIRRFINTRRKTQIRAGQKIRKKIVKKVRKKYKKSKKKY